MTVTNKTRHRSASFGLVVLMVLVGLVMAACGDDDTHPTPAAAGTGTATGTATAMGTAIGTATADHGASGDASGFPRTVTHAMGETEIPAQPERVVVLDTGELDSVTALGIEPVGAVRAPVEDGLLDYLENMTAGTELIGTISEPDLEAIAGLQPDLILSNQLRHGDIYDELSQIAPTVFTETVGVAWKDNFLLHAEALGKTGQADQMLADYHARAEQLGEAIPGPQPTISIVRFLPGQTRLYQNASFIGTILHDVGLPRPEPQDVDDFALMISVEQINLADGEVIFASHYGPPDETTRLGIIDGSLWNSLEAVQDGRVYEVNDDTWMLGIGIQAANIVLDDLEEHLLE